MDTKLPISVNICTLNESGVLKECLEHVERNNPKEIIVIDGGSTDSTVSIAKDFGAKVIHSKKKGLSSQRQEGINASNEKFIAIIDADDHLETDFLQTLLFEIDEYNFDALLGREIALKPRTYWEKAMNSVNKNITFTKNPISTKMVGRPALYRRGAIISCGFDPFFDGVGCEDADLSIRMEMAGYKQGIGTGLTRRKQSATTKDIFSKIIKYGKGDSRLVVKYPNKSLNILFHQLIRYPIIRVIQIVLQGKIIYIPFFVLMGFGRFFSMVIELPKSYLMSK